MDSLIALPTERLLQKFGSGGHKPGSGSAAALLGVVACKLVQTVVSLSDGRIQYADVMPQLTLANQELADRIEMELLRDLQEDSVQFDRVISARRKVQAAEDPTRRRKLQKAALHELKIATDLPISIARNCLAVADAAFTVFDLGFRSARGDSGVAISAAIGGASGALSVVYLNLSSFRGGTWARERRQKADVLLSKLNDAQYSLSNRIVRLQLEGIPGPESN